MLILVALIAGASATFIEQPLPGVAIGSIVPFTGLPSTNYRQSDLNADGLLDLVLEDGVMIQKAGAFPADARAPLPAPGESVEADLFDGKLYYRTANRLTVFAFDDERWRQVLDQPLDWPGAETLPARPPGGGRRVSIRRFVYDIDVDGSPELIGLDGRGLHIFRQRNGRYEPAGQFDIMPAVVLVPPAMQELWPASARRIVLPDRQLSCRLLVQANSLTLIRQLAGAGDDVIYERSIMPLQQESGGDFSVSGTELWTSPALPAYVRPCHLNRDGVMDFAGSRWLLSKTTPLPMPIFEVRVSLDGGATFDVRRAPCFQRFRPFCTYADFDSDGDMDLVTESTTLYDSGVRETVNRFLTATRLQHRIVVYPQESGAFAEEPAFTHTVELDLGAPPAAGGAMVGRYQGGKLLQMTGDFNADGFLDLAVQTSASDLNIHLSLAGAGFAGQPFKRIGVPADANFSVADINGDGRADILLEWPAAGPGGATVQTTAYLSRETSR